MVSADSTRSPFQASPEVPELLTTAEVAARVRKHPKTVERAIRNGRLRAARPSGSDRGPYGVAPQWIDEWIAGALVARGPRHPAPASSHAAPSRASRTLPLTPDMGRDRKTA